MSLSPSSRAGALAVVVVLCGLVGVAFIADDFVLSMLTLVFLFAAFGQSWNILTGYAGQISLGHALYAGLGAYTVGVLATRFGLSPWVGIPAGVMVSCLAGAMVASLGFRFAVAGVYFALLTIAFAEFTRVLFDNWPLVGGSGGLFWPARAPGVGALAQLRGDARFFYLLALAVCAGATLVVALLARSRIGTLWRAIREDEDAARALGVHAFRLKVLAAVLSAALASVTGSVFGLLNGSLFPDTMLGMRLSIDIIVAPIIGGLGTVLGPLVGAALVIPLLEGTNRIGAAFGIYGLNTVAYGLAIVGVVVLVPEGLWPALARRLGRAP